jgi:peptidyl-tRNA hydrolase, PTH2 family
MSMVSVAPVPLVVSLGCGLLAGFLGAALGSALVRSRAMPVTPAHVDDASSGAADVDSDEDSDVVPQSTELKMVLLVREDLKMSKGKIAAQCGHAVLACYRNAIRGNSLWREWVRAWLHRAQAKITLKVDSEQLMDAICAAAIAAKLPCEVIEDAGRTEVAPGTRTVAGIGPCPKDLIDRITGPKGSHPLRLLA